MEETGKQAKPAQEAASSLLDNDDLLREILLRLDFPTSLVRAAAVSKRWLRHASDPAFLRRFRRLHPPRLLGIYFRALCFNLFKPHPSDYSRGAAFVAMAPLPPEYAAVIRRGSFELGDGPAGVWHCLNGRVAFSRNYGDDRVVFFRPLHPWRGNTALPDHPFPEPVRYGRCGSRRYLLLPEPEDGGSDVACTVVTYMSNAHGICAHISELLQSTGTWSQGRTSDWLELELPQWSNRSLPPLFAHGKIFAVCVAGYVLGLDPGSLSMSFFCIRLPQGVEYCEDNNTKNIALCRAEDAGFFLIHLKGSRMCVWIHTTGCMSGNWQLVDSICLHQVSGYLGDPTFKLSRDAAIRVVAAGDNADFVCLEVESKILYIHIRSRVVEMVFEAPEYMSRFEVQPFMMVWPPTFPSWSNGCDLEVE